MKQVILVDTNDNPIGSCEKIEAHEKALLHRAFSVFLFYKNKNGELELLLQKRHPDKYHCGGLWTNSCCSHPMPNEETIAAGERRVFEELGVTVKLNEVGSFTYKAEFNNGLTEHEFDHVLIGFTDNKKINFHPEEISEITWLTIPEVENKLNANPDTFTPWFKQALRLATT